MRMQTQIKFLLCLTVLAGCSKGKVDDNSHGTVGTNNFNVTPSPLSGTGITVYNACSSSIWIMALKGAVSGSGTTIVNSQKLAPGKRMLVPAVEAGKIWAKFGCNSSGTNCLIGDQLAPGNQPPIDTGFEFTYTNNWYYNFSAVDGFTAPMKLIPNGGGTGCNTIFTTDFSVSSVCPTNEILNTPISDWASPLPAGLTAFGNFTTYYVPQPFKAVLGDSINLSTPRSLVYTTGGRTMGCIAPGKFLTTPPPYGLGIAVCKGTDCDSRNGPQDIDINGATAGTYDARVVMYSNPYNGCDLTSNMDGTQQSTITNPPNCAANQSIEYTATRTGAFPSGQSFFVYLGGNSAAPNPIAFCHQGTNADTSIYCNDTAAQGGQGTGLRGSTAASNMSRLGPILRTQYVQNVHNNLPDTYAYQYDDANALQTCQNLNAQLVLMIGCPNP